MGSYVPPELGNTVCKYMCKGLELSSRYPFLILNVCPFRASRRYVFQCLSATYYHRERDCILNVDNRQVHPEVFEKNEQSEYNVTYLGMTCGVGKKQISRQLFGSLRVPVELR